MAGQRVPLSQFSSLALEQPPARVYERLRSAIVRDPQPAASALHRGDTSLSLIAALCVTPALLFLSTYHSLTSRVAHALLAVVLPGALLALAFAMVTTRLARSRSDNGLGPSVRALSWIALSILPLSVLPLLHRSWQLAAAVSTPAEVYAREPYCFPIASLVIGVSLFALSRGFRHTVPVGAGWRSAALGAAAGAWGILAMLLYCPDVNIVHLLVKHIAPVLLAPLAGLLLLRRYVRL